MLRLAPLLLLVACPAVPLEPLDSGQPPVDAGGADSGVPDAGQAPPPIEWSRCPLHSELDTGEEAECATVPLPLRAEDESAGTIDVFVKRWAPDGGTRARQLWMLMGGPGGSGMGYEGIIEQLGSRATDLEFYLPDHRGTGRSHRLGCPVQEAGNSPSGMFIGPDEWAGCIQRVVSDEGGRLTAYDTTHAAQDLGQLIARARQPGQPVFVYGASYGTWWAQRYLQLFPHQADGVILDSMVAPEARGLDEQDSDANEAGQLFFDTVCKSDPLCAQKLGPDPWATAQAIFSRLKAGHCAGFAAGYGAPANLLLRRAFGQMMMGFALRPYIAAALYRADRCSAADQAALARMMTSFFPATLPAATRRLYQLWGFVLSNNITFSEMFAVPAPTAMQLQQTRDDAVVSRDVTSSMDAVVGTWPTYTPDAYVGGYAHTDVPMLMLAGGLDPATLLRKQRLVKPHFTGAHQTWLEFPLGAHGILSSSPTDAGTSCGTATMVGFMRDPTAPVDAGCMSALRGLDFAGTPATSMQLFGTTDPWD